MILSPPPAMVYGDRVTTFEYSEKESEYSYVRKTWPVRSPREVLGQPTFGLAMWLLKWLPIHVVDQILLLVAQTMLGDTAQLGLKRPSLGPLELKSLLGKTPVLDVGTLAKIKSGDIKVQPAIRQIAGRKVLFMDGQSEEFDIIVLATGYKSNVPCWLKDRELFSQKDGLPRKSFPNGWKGEKGLHSVGFSGRGLMGTAADARIAHDIELLWKAKEKNLADTLPLARELFVDDDRSPSTWSL